MRVVVTGGAGFIGSHLVDRLMSAGHTVTVLDNLRGGDMEFLTRHRGSPRFRFVNMDVRHEKQVSRALGATTDVVFHLAANADIARGAEVPTLDFEHSIVSTFSLLNAMRERRVRKFVYTSGSGVYGDRGTAVSTERTGPLTPISMYGASKLGAEGLISAFAHLYNMQAWIVRPANITGPRVTHGVALQFVQRLMHIPTTLRVLGDGQQTRSYLHVSDALDALFIVFRRAKERVNIFNVSGNTFLTVDAVAALVMRGMGLRRVKIVHTGGSAGWKGDVPEVRLAADPLRALGWRPRYTSSHAVTATVRALLEDPRIIGRRTHVRASLQ